MHGGGAAKVKDVQMALEPPEWSLELVRDEAVASWREIAPRLTVRSMVQPGFSLISGRVQCAVALTAMELQQATVAAYETIAARLSSLPTPHPVRIWNFIPRILDPIDDMPHRYMVFNAGRFAAYIKWYETLDCLRQSAVTASGVGHFGEDLLVHCLAARRPGEMFENPRQVPAHRYSDRYGPMPPCFARATRLDQEGSRPLLLVGGTASVTGEDTAHPTNLRRQLREILRNLAALVGRAEGLSSECSTNGRRDELLGRFRKLRAYVVRRADIEVVRHLAERHFPCVDDFEYVHAHLCRPELVLEIEGVAELVT